MPQMSPLSWWLLFMYFIILLLMFSIMNYFVFFYKAQEVDSMKIETKSMNWKW
uniref:ATP synthase complex subunit 8 n=1 Tax=Libelloides macaronius TaxID=146496 RepID=F6I9V5_LIBMA|nr:ATP synthase F0 subunit 8 [Libelloides macaronius]CBW30522.1 ATP synthase F0 subunit 8 [Libelloides macaronius]